MIAPEDLYILDVTEFAKDLYRMGNARWPNFGEDRARVDVPIAVQNGVEVAIANGNGFSASDKITKTMQKPGKKVWKIKKGARLPDEIVIVKDLRPGYDRHYMLAPSKNMPLRKYLGALEELGMDPTRVQLITVGVQ